MLLRTYVFHSPGLTDTLELGDLAGLIDRVTFQGKEMSTRRKYSGDAQITIPLHLIFVTLQKCDKNVGLGLSVV